MFGLNPEAKREKAYSDRDWDKVISIAVKQDDGDIKALNDLAEAYHQKGMLNEALETCKKIDRLHPVTDFSRQVASLGVRYMRYHLVYAHVLYARKRYDEAMQVIERLRFLKGHLSDKFHLAAQIHLVRGHVDQAVSEYEQMWKVRQDRADKIVKNLQAIIVKHPRGVKAHRLLQEIQKSRGQLQAMAAEWEKAVRGGAKDPSEVYRLGYYYQFEGQQPKALELFQQYAQQHPEDHELHWVLGDLFSERGDFGKAMAEYRQVAEQSPEKLSLVLDKLDRLAHHASDRQKPAVVSELIHLYLQSGNFAAARKWLEMVAPSSALGAEMKGAVMGMLAACLERHEETGEMDAAKTILEMILLLDPNNATYQDRLTQMEEILVQKKIAEQEEMIRTGRLSGQEANWVLYELGETYLKRGESEDKVLSVYQQLARSESPFQHHALLRLGLTFLHKGLEDLAQNQFDKLQQAALPEAKKTEYFYDIGFAYEKMGYPDRAREYYKRVFELNANYQDVAQRLAQLPQKTIAPAAAAAPAAAKPSMSVVEERYEQIVRIGAGGMGTVFRAIDRVLRRPVALKFMKDEYQSDGEAVARFIREAQAASHLKHPGIVAIYDIHVREPIYIAMEFVEGSTLRDIMKRGEMSFEGAFPVIEQTCAALAYAHSQGVVHRDIKPDNILVAKGGVVKIVDFGLARVQEEFSAMTRTGTVMGTPVYMAPEQIQGKVVDLRTDMYAFGVMLYEMLAGKVPFGEGDIAYRQIHETPMLPGLINPKIPKHLETIVMTCLKKRPEDRYPNMEAVGLALRAS
jgi:tetratricopeptide (TPR) repeat protein/tRNA A-37 threonylcarbamoyl transferase component Bud32